MHDICTYLVEVVGEVDEAALNSSSPINVQVGWVESESTRLTIQSDQSGFVGLLRHLHQQGFLLLSASRE